MPNGFGVFVTTSPNLVAHLPNDVSGLVLLISVNQLMDNVNYRSAQICFSGGCMYMRTYGGAWDSWTKLI